MECRKIWSGRNGNLSVDYYQLWSELCVLSHSVGSSSLQPCGLQPARLLCSWNSPGKNIGVGCQFLLQGIVPFPGMELVSLVSPELVGWFFTTEPHELSGYYFCALHILYMSFWLSYKSHSLIYYNFLLLFCQFLFLSVFSS